MEKERVKWQKSVLWLRKGYRGTGNDGRWVDSSELGSETRPKELTNSSWQPLDIWKWEGRRQRESRGWDWREAGAERPVCAAVCPSVRLKGCQVKLLHTCHQGRAQMGLFQAAETVQEHEKILITKIWCFSFLARVLQDLGVPIWWQPFESQLDC